MSDLENKKAEEAPKKRPYNLREKKEKKAAYRSLIRPELADELYDKILNIVVVQKKYKDPDYSAKDLANSSSSPLQIALYHVVFLYSVLLISSTNSSVGLQNINTFTSFLSVGVSVSL